MSPACRTICDNDGKHATHGRVHGFLFDLILDLDLIRIGRPPRHHITRERLATWPAVSQELRSCQMAVLHQLGLRDKHHEQELDWGTSLVTHLTESLAAGESPSLPEPFKSDWRANLDRIMRCREDSIKR